MDMIKYGISISVRYIPLATCILAGACAQVPPQEQSPTAASEPPTVAVAQTASKPPPGPVRLRSDHPQNYVVMPEDTLYDVAARFLETPWRWPEVWRPGALASGDPNLIYPGEVVELFYENGQPRLRLAKGPSTIKLSPQVRVETITQPIPTIPRSAIEGFLTRTVVLDPAGWEAAPRVVGNLDDRVILGNGDRIYVRGPIASDQQHYRVFHRGDEYYDPVTRQSLGIGGIYVGDAVLEQEGDPSTLLLTAGRRDARIGDYLFPVEDELENYSFVPHSPPEDTEGRIIAIQDGSIVVGQYQSVVVDLGEHDGMEPGHMLRIYSVGHDIGNFLTGSALRLPDEKTGLLMLYKVHDHLSYGLVMTAGRDVQVSDRVATP